MNVNKISFGLFMFRGKNWWCNLKDIPIFIERIFFTLKHGYSPVAKWETSGWFMSVMNEILVNYRHNRMGTPILIGDYEENEDAYNKILDHMIEILGLMDENNKIYDDMDWKESDKARESAKNEFFKLFSEHFYEFWD